MDLRVEQNVQKNVLEANSTHTQATWDKGRLWIPDACVH